MQLFVGGRSSGKSSPTLLRSGYFSLEGTNILALTATATKDTRKVIIDKLEIKDVYGGEVAQQQQYSYVVFNKPKERTKIIDPIIDEVAVKKDKSKKHPIFCRTYDEASEFCRDLSLGLGRRNALYTKEPSTLTMAEQTQHRLCDKFDADAVKQQVIESFTKCDGVLRVVLATIAFSMGLDSPNIWKVVHWVQRRT